MTLWSLTFILNPAHLCRDAQAGGQPWSFTGARATQPMQRWSPWARRRRASLSLSSAEGGGGACIPAAPPSPLLPLLCRPSSLLLHRDFSPGTSRICSPVDELSVHNGSLRLWNRPIERYMRPDRAANDMRKWENPRKLIPDLDPLFSFCWQGTDQPGTGNSIDDFASVSIG